MARLKIPTIRPRHAVRLNKPTAVSLGLQGSAVPGSGGGVVTNAVTYREIVACPGASQIRVRILTDAVATGTLNVKPIAPIQVSAAGLVDETVQAANGTIDPLKVTAYSTGTGTVAVLANTEAKVDLALFGENYVMIEYVCSATGVLTWVDVSMLVYT